MTEFFKIECLIIFLFLTDKTDLINNIGKEFRFSVFNTSGFGLPASIQFF